MISVSVEVAERVHEIRGAEGGKDAQGAEVEESAEIPGVVEGVEGAESYESLCMPRMASEEPQTSQQIVQELVKSTYRNL